MKNPIFVSVLLCCLFAMNLHAQDKLSWKKHVKLADQLYAKAQYADAGEHYRAAFKQKTKKKELANKAGDCFYIIRDYRNAADAWKNVKDDKDFPLVGLYYARCLKQNGEYEAASSELVNFLGHYNLPDKSIVSQIVQNELKGCELAAQLAVKGDDPNITVSHLNSNVNTTETEFAPFPFGEDVLYFSSTMAKRAEIYRTMKTGGDWGKATPIDKFPVISEGHFCNGILSPDASRFYFTVCKSVENWGGLTTQCDIYVTRASGKTWSEPERLPDYINEANATSTHPYIVQENNTETLYFASNRKGGMGGMDVWYTTREMSSTANDFTLPINAGSRINTIGDEITPYYDFLNKDLYFSSNGQASMGGYDIFKAKGARSMWEGVENVGTPLNSPADDFFFIKTKTGQMGFLVSNRMFGADKISTTNEDIFSFQFNEPVRQWVARGEAYSKQSGTILDDVEITLYEVGGAAQKIFVSKIISGNGHYDFAVEPSKKYLVEATKDGFFPAEYDFDTNDFANVDDFGGLLYLESYDGVGGEEPVGMKEDNNETQKIAVNEKVEIPAATTPKKNGKTAAANPTKEEKASDAYVSRGKAKEDNLSIVSEAPRQTGTYYKIQIIALGNDDLGHSRYKNVKNLGRLDTEYILDRKLYRVLIADYASAEEAMSDLPAIRKEKDFGTAFIVEYKDGERIGKVEF